MAEELKKKTTTTNNKSGSSKKKKNKKKQTANKTNEVKVETSKQEQKKEEVKKNKQPKQEVKKTEPKKVEKKPEVKKEVKKETPKNDTPKKEELKKEEKVVEVEIKKEEKDSLLERTIIFDSKSNKNIREVVNKLEEDTVQLEARIIKRSKGRKIAIIILTAIMLSVIIGVTAYVITDQIRQEENKQTINSDIYKKVKRNYKEIKDNANTKPKEEIKYSNIETITLADFEKKVLEKEDMYVLISSTTCYACLTYEPVINETFEKLDKKVYRLDIVSLKQEEVTRFRTYYAFKKTPTIFTIKNGIATSETVGTMNQENLTKWVNETA